MIPYKKSRIILIGFFIILLFLTRFYNLDHTARFLWDESSDLVRMHQFYKNLGFTFDKEKKIFGDKFNYYLSPPLR